MSDVKPVAWQRFDEIGEYDSYMGSVEEGDYVKYDDALATVTALQAEIEAIRKDARYAEYGRVAMRFVDRAGDVHPGIDDAETICAEFHEAMSKAIDAAIAKEKQP